MRGILLFIQDQGHESTATWDFWYWVFYKLDGGRIGPR